LLPAGTTVAEWELHPRKIDAFARRTLTPFILTPFIFGLNKDIDTQPKATGETLTSASAIKKNVPYPQGEAAQGAKDPRPNSYLDPGVEVPGTSNVYTT
jgi:hypothetical protein